MASFGVFDSFFITKAIQEWGRALYSPWQSKWKLIYIKKIQALELRSPFPKPNQECEEKQREESNMKKFKRRAARDTFWELPRVHFIHTIYIFEAWEVRSPTLQTMCKSELKWRSYGHWKTTAPSQKTISQVAKSQIQLAKSKFNLRNGQFQLAKFLQVMFQLAKSTCVILDICDWIY